MTPGFLAAKQAKRLQLLWGSHIFRRENTWAVRERPTNFRLFQDGQGGATGTQPVGFAPQVATKSGAVAQCQDQPIQGRWPCKQARDLPRDRWDL